ncbi:hypothetical protein EXIGLDRAFT_643216 [Exidia glandulosa HHB12029]|uniref:Zinc finger Mcm10/DnaG-type domain-containing protein n=1 Tax=Exidia glandulosa HHB12029 TaxID=1314781 RepID=A0A165KJI8_EXIGL|nr:hypothetical protein EXIGLDRAFT_643216 [Exidia glandulosa HHB12029]
MPNGVYVIAPATPAAARTADGHGATGGSKATVPMKRKQPAKPADPVYHVPAKSNYVSSLARLSSTKVPSTIKNSQETRSTSFAQPAAPPPSVDDTATQPAPASKRDDTLAVIEELKMGPYEFKAPPDDPSFQGFEPHSKIRLSSRAMPHEEFSDMLRGRYFISPSTLYSVVRPQPGRTGYDVPVDGDWVTIGVIAEHGPIRTTISHQSTTAADDDDASNKRRKLNNGDKDKPVDGAKAVDGKSTQQKQAQKPRGKRFVNFKLVDFGTREISSSNAQIRGDAVLSLLLFEADQCDMQVDAATGKKTRLFRGGSRGAYEAQGKLREGTVVAFLNPRILKPMQNNAPHRTQNVLAITPESAESMIVLGHSKDLGMCIAKRKDGKPCGSWFDKRCSEACDFHLQKAVQSKRAARPEFTAGNAGMANFSRVAQTSKQPAYDPTRKWGLKPEVKRESGNETYIVGGHTVSARAPALEFAHEKMGREREARKARKRADDTIETLLLARDDPSADTVRDALKAIGRYKEKPKTSDEMAKEEAANDERERLARKVFNADKIKTLGFDPLVLNQKFKANAKPADGAETSRQVAELTAHCSARQMSLGRRPGEKVRSGIVKPVAHTRHAEEEDDDLEIEPPAPSKQSQRSEPSDDELDIGLPDDDEPATKAHNGSTAKNENGDSDDDDAPLYFPDSDEDMD